MNYVTLVCLVYVKGNNVINFGLFGDICHSLVFMYLCTCTYTMQIMTGIEVNSEANFQKLREYCPSAKGRWAIFPQLREISLTIDRWW